GDRVIFSYEKYFPSPPNPAPSQWNIEAKVFNRSFDPPLLVETLNLSTGSLYGGPSTNDDFNCRLAVNPANSVVLVGWETVYSSTDHDMWAQFVAMVPVASITVSPVSGLITTEAGGTAQCTVCLG